MFVIEGMPEEKLFGVFVILEDGLACAKKNGYVEVEVIEYDPDTELYQDPFVVKLKEDGAWMLAPEMEEIMDTAQAINDMADCLRRYANELDLIAKKLRSTRDLQYAAEAANCIENCVINLRLSRVVSRALKEK